MTDCIICLEGITAQTGKTVLGCGHEFHMMCVVRWFQGQKGPSSCPHCRHTVGTLDNVPILEGNLALTDISAAELLLALRSSS